MLGTRGNRCLNGGRGRGFQASRVGNRPNRSSARSAAISVDQKLWVLDGSETFALSGCPNVVET